MSSMHDLIQECLNTVTELHHIHIYGNSDEDQHDLITQFAELEKGIKRVLAELPRPRIEFMVSTVLSWMQNRPIKDLLAFRTTPFDKLIVYHESLGSDIRKHFYLFSYPWTPMIQDRVDHSEHHPDNLSMRVIEEVWRKLQDAP